MKLFPIIRFVAATALATAGLCVTSCQDDASQLKKSSNDPDAVEVLSDPTFKSPLDVAGGRVETSGQSILATIRVWLSRGPKATGSVQLRLVESASNTIYARTGWTNVSVLTVGSALQLYWNLPNTMTLAAGKTYRIDIACSANSLRSIIYGADGTAPIEDHEILWVSFFPGNYAQGCEHKIIVDTDVNESHCESDFMFQTLRANFNGDVVIDQKNTQSGGSFTTINGVTSSKLPNGAVYGQEFVPTASTF